MKFTTYTHEGGREYNEDFLATAFENKIYCFAVADGFGPDGSGRAGAEIAVNSVIEAFKNEPEMSSEAVKKYITEAQRALLVKKSEEARFGDIGSTIALLLTDGTKAIWASVGDTRIYIYKGASLEEVSEDHSVSFEKFAKGEIEYDEIRTDSEANKLRKALGDRISWEPDVSEVFNITSSHSFLICTDGFWRNISEKETELLRLISVSSKGWLKKMLKKIAPKIHSGSDNLSVIAVTMQYGDSI